jgi:hypothetical protein
MNALDLKIALCDIDNGRFEDIIHVLRFVDSCSKCSHFNLSINDQFEGYRCKCAPKCIAATLSNKLLSYLNWKIGWIDEKQHLINIKNPKSG